MHYDPTKIEEQVIEINGKKVPLYKIPAGMSGPNAYRLYENAGAEDKPEEDDDEVDFSIKKNSIYDEENIFIENSNSFIDL